MPKSKAKSGMSSWRVSSHQLSDSARDSLANTLGRDGKASANDEGLWTAFRDIELVLGAYHGNVEALDNAPTSADYRSWCLKLREVAEPLMKSINSLPQRFEEELRTESGDPEAFPDPLIAELLKLDAAITTVEKKYAGGESRGRKTKIALNSVIAVLRKIFQREYAGAATPRGKRGAITMLATRDKSEEEFVITALRDAGIRFSGKIRIYFVDENGKRL
jgi:hypothetical protein